MKRSMLLPALIAVAALTTGVVSADAQDRRGGGRRGGGERGGGERGGGERGAERGGARTRAPRDSRPIIIVPGVTRGVPRRHAYPYRPGFSVGFYSGYPYGYGAFPYAYRRHGNPYGYYSGYGPGYGYGRYPYGPGGYGPGYAGAVHGGLRIQGAPHDAQVFADGYYLGVVDSFDGVFQQANLTPGPHRIEIRASGFPSLEFDVRIEPGQTITYHADGP